MHNRCFSPHDKKLIVFHHFRDTQHCLHQSVPQLLKMLCQPTMTLMSMLLLNQIPQKGDNLEVSHKKCMFKFTFSLAMRKVPSNHFRLLENKRIETKKKRTGDRFKSKKLNVVKWQWSSYIYIYFFLWGSFIPFLFGDISYFLEKLMKKKALPLSRRGWGSARRTLSMPNMENTLLGQLR